ncbi:EAL domain-containing protein [Vogesella sp. LIG4]|uniref:EAL domain-containing protein n=1 Tax=Vogesella sp. LIG4 TaxID=1192162 RepID=UPI00139050C4|nr:EAL domain-containing protein [Vogesella sp. LIG4]
MTGSVTAQSVLTQVGQAVVVPRYVGDSQYEKQNLAPLMQWCEDRQERTVEEARRSCDWRHTRQNSFHFGASKAVYWLSVRLHNGSSASRNVVVDFGVSHEDYLDWYVLDSASGNRLTQGRMGDRLPMQVRSLPTRHQGIPVQVPASRDVELYVRSASFDGWHQLLQPQLLSEKAYLEAEQKEDFANGLIFGGLGAIVIVAFSAYTATRQRSILLYGLALAGLLVYSMAKTSYDLMFLWPNAPGLHSRIVFIVGPLTILLYTALVFDLLKARSHLPRWLWNGLMLWCTLAAVSGLPAVFDHIQWAVYSTLVAAWLTLPVFLTVCWLAIRQVPGAWMMVIAVAAQVVAVLLNALRAMGLLRTVTFDQSVFQMAGLFQALVLAYAMARILIQMRQEKLKAAQQAHEAHTRLRAQEEHELRHDKLTGLPNRLALLEWLRQRMDQQRPFAVIHIGIFDFKAVNDQFGHAGGDYALLELSRRCQALLGPGDMMAKQLSDQFILVLHGMDTIQALSVASQLMQRLTQPIAYAESEIVLRPRMGLAAYPEDGKEAEILLQHAHIAKREAAHLVSHIQTYHSGSDKIFERRNLLLRDLRSAIAGEQFLMVYQPKLNLRTGQVDKAEALLRWDHPQLGRISPVEFIPLVERADASWQLSMWVLERGIAQMAKWRQRGYHIGLALNLSAQDLHHRQLPEQVRKLLESYEVPAAQLTLEITESGIMQNLDSVRLVLAALCELGVTLSIDDFGTGYSSLAMLKQLPVKELKIDRAFVAPLERSSSEQSDDAAIIRSIIGIGHSVGMRVVAEGVETLAVARLLESWQCEYVQGYWLKPPLAADQFIDWLAAGTGHYITELQPALP